jgi:hypothetical protein
MKVCAICSAEFDGHGPASVYAEAGEWLAEEVWNDAGSLCPRCLENRAKLAMMYCHDVNT